MTLHTVVPQVIAALFLLAATYVFNDRLRRIEVRQDRFEEQITSVGRQVAVLGSQFAGFSERIERVESEIGVVRTELAGLRADLTQIALALGARPRPQTG